MPPPQLARDAPVMNIAHPLEVRLGVLFRRKSDKTLLDRGNRRVGERLNPDKPLRREQRLNHGFAAVALADGVHMVAHPGQQILRFQIGQNPLPRLRSDPGRHKLLRRHSCAPFRPSR